MPTKVIVGGAELTVSNDVVQVNKSGSPLPGSIVGAKPSTAKVVSDKISVLADEHFNQSGLEDNANHRPVANGRAVDPITPVVITENGNRVFSGNLEYSRSKVSALSSAGLPGIEHGYDILSDGGILWPSLEGRTLRELDLGTVTWDEESVIASWTDTVDNQPGIFAPALYGELIDAIFTTSDVRYHVYFRPIIMAIFEQLAGFRVDSSFFDTELFKSCAHTFGVGDAMETELLVPPSVTGSTGTVFTSVLVDGVVNPVPLNTSSNVPEVGSWSNVTHEFTPAEAGTFTIQLDYAYTGDIDTVYINKNGSPIGSLSGNGSAASGAFAVDLLLSDVLTLEAVANTSPGQIENLTALVTLDVAQNEARIITVSTCLPDTPVKDFVRGVAHMFNLEFGVDSVRRVVTIEPRFPYEIGGVSFPGFYQLTEPRDIVGTVDSSRDIVVERLDKYPDRMVFAYKNSTTGLADYYANQLPDDEGIPVNGVRLSNGSTNPKTEEYFNPYFVPIRASNVYGLSNALAIPHLWKRRRAESETAIGKFTLEPPTYEHPPSCGLVQRNSTTILWNTIGNAVRAPLLAQSLSFDNVEIPFVLAYGDQPTFDPGVEAPAVVYPGLGTTFYKHLASSLTRGRLVTMPVTIPNALEVYTETFRRPISLRYEPSATHLAILLSIKGYQPGGAATMQLLTFVGAGFVDSISTRHYRFNPIILEPNGNTCSYSLVDDFPYDDGIQNKPVVGIALENGYVLPIGYPYNSTTAGDPARLEADILRALGAAGAPASSVVATVTPGATDVWSIAINGTRAWLRGVYISTTPIPVLNDFTQVC